MNAWKQNPSVRYWTRVIVVAAIGYVGTVFTTIAVSEFDAKSFLWGLGGAIFMGLGYALVGGTTPIEPFVGIGKVDDVKVPSAPATVRPVATQTPSGP